MIIESKIDFQPSEIDELFNSIIGIAAKVKLGMDMKGKIAEARWEKNENLQREKERYEQRLKEMEEDHKAELKALKAEIEKLKEAKKEAKKPVAVK